MINIRTGGIPLAERARRTLALSKLFLLKNARILRKFSLFGEFVPSKSEAKAKRTLLNFLRSEANSLRFRNFRNKANFALRIYTPARTKGLGYYF